MSSKTSPVALRLTEAWPRHGAAACSASVQRATRQCRALCLPSHSTAVWWAWNDVLHRLPCFMALPSWIYQYRNLLLRSGVSKCCDVQLVGKLCAWSGIGRGIAVRWYIRKKGSSNFERSQEVLIWDNVITKYFPNDGDRKFPIAWEHP